MRAKSVDVIRKMMASKAFTVPGYHLQFRDIKVISGGNGSLNCELDISQDMLNLHKSLHGGFTAGLIDFVSSFALAGLGDGRLGVSTDLNVSYLRPAFENETILIEAKTLKYGKNMAVGVVDILNKQTNKLIATGRHTKFLGEGKVNTDM